MGMEHNKIETKVTSRKDKNNFKTNWAFFIKWCCRTELHYLLLCPLTRFPLVLKINSDDLINGEKYKVPLMTNLVNMNVMRTQDMKPKRELEKKNLNFRKHLSTWSVKTNKSLEFVLLYLPHEVRDMENNQWFLEPYSSKLGEK